MCQPDNELRWFPAFAALTVRADARTIVDYRRWVSRVGQHGYADELIVAAAACELRLQIVVVPYTPRTARDPWPLSRYQQDQPMERVVYLANNDVHHVWLVPTAVD